MRPFDSLRCLLPSLIAILLALPPANDAAADEPVDEEALRIVEKLKQFEAKIKSLSMHVEVTRSWNEMNDPGGNRVKRTISLTDSVDSIGRCREEGTGQILLGREAGHYKLHDGTIRTIFDGTSALRLQEVANPKGKKGWFGANVNDMQWVGIDPREVTTHIDGESISKVFAEAHVDNSAIKWAEGGNVTILETPTSQYDGPKANQGLRKQTAWVAPHLGYAVVRWAKLVQVSPDEPWQEYFETGGEIYREVAPGVFLPGKIYQRRTDYARVRRQGNFLYEIEGAVTEWKLNQDFPADTFALTVPEGAKISDERTKSQGATREPGLVEKRLTG